MGYPKRGQIWRVNFDPTVGGEIKKTRPAVIISNDHNNQYALTVTVLPVSDCGKEIFPFEVGLPRSIQGLTKDSKIKCQQVRTIDKSRLIQYLGDVPESVLLEIEKALKIHLKIDD